MGIHWNHISYVNSATILNRNNRLILIIQVAVVVPFAAPIVKYCTQNGIVIDEPDPSKVSLLILVFCIAK